MRYELYYWPGIQGRGEFVRLALEAGGADYLDVGNAAADGCGEPALMRYLQDGDVARPPFAPPYLKAGRQLIGQTASILQFLGPRLGLVSRHAADRLWTQQLQLTIADAVAEAHDSHHPISVMQYYEDQRPEARRRAQDFTQNRIAKFFDYFEGVLARKRHGAPHLVGKTLSYADLSLFQLIEGLRYAFPRTMQRREAQWPQVMALHEQVRTLPRIQAYLQSPRRLAFNQTGLFRHYPELDLG